MTMELVADVVGGGANGRLGLEKVFGGLVNMLTGNAISLVYTDTTGWRRSASPSATCMC